MDDKASTIIISVFIGSSLANERAQFLLKTWETVERSSPGGLVKEKVFCSFCRVPNKVYKNKHITPLAMLAFGFVSVLFSFLVWEEFNFVALGIFLVLCFWTEFFTRSKWRQSLKCTTCGFDPVIYRHNPEDAAKIVKEFLENRKEDPNYLLKPQPKIKPIIRKQQITEHEIKSHIEI